MNKEKPILNEEASLNDDELTEVSGGGDARTPSGSRPRQAVIYSCSENHRYAHEAASDYGFKCPQCGGALNPVSSAGGVFF